MNTITPKNELAAYMDALGRNARAATRVLRLATAEMKANANHAIAGQIRTSSAKIIKANALDMDAGREKGLSAAMLDRLELDKSRVEAMATGLEAIATLPDPVGHEEDRWTRPNGLTIAKVRTSIGVISMIYESRPNVTADAAGLCLKSGNACILRGGSEAQHSNIAIYKAIQTGLREAGFSAECVQYVQTTDRAAVGAMLAGLDGNIDLIIPRGGKSLVARVQSDARIPVLAHLEGRNHTYIHAPANPEMANAVTLNAKMRRPGTCGATETLLIDQGAIDVLPGVADALQSAGCRIKGSKEVRAVVDYAEPVTDEDFYTEYLDAIINVKVVKGIEEALAHIANYGSGHTEAIITDDRDAAEKFLREADSAIVLHNASTQFADGGEFGFGAEIGIATGRLHARGPVGAQHLTSYKYQVLGTGQTRP